MHSLLPLLALLPSALAAPAAPNPIPVKNPTAATILTPSLSGPGPIPLSHPITISWTIPKDSIARQRPYVAVEWGALRDADYGHHFVLTEPQGVPNVGYNTSDSVLQSVTWDPYLTASALRRQSEEFGGGMHAYDIQQIAQFKDQLLSLRFTDSLSFNDPKKLNEVIVEAKVVGGWSEWQGLPVQLPPKNATKVGA